MKNILFMMVAAFLFAMTAFADSTAVVGAINGIQTSVTPLDPDAAFQALLLVIQNFGVLGWALKTAGIIVIILAFVKVSFMQPVWAKLGAFQAIAAPILSIIVGIFTLIGSGAPVTFPAILTFLSTGGMAIALHELLDMIKALPGIGPIYVGIIDSIEGALGGGASATAMNQVKK